MVKINDELGKALHKVTKQEIVANHIQALESLVKAADFEGIAGQPKYLFDMGLARVTIKSMSAIRESITIMKQQADDQFVTVPVESLQKLFNYARAHGYRAIEVESLLPTVNDE